MRPNDLLEYRCPTTGIVWQWRIHSIKLGGARQESLIEISPVMASDGETLTGKASSVWVPEPMTRHLKLIAFDGYGVPKDDDPEPNPDCPPQEYRIADDMASNIVASSFDPSPLVDFIKRAEEQKKAARLWRDTVRNLDQRAFTRATSEMRTIIARLEAEATETEDDGA